MQVEMSEATFNLLGNILTSDLNLPIKSAQVAAIAQAEWAKAAELANADQEAEEEGAIA